MFAPSRRLLARIGRWPRRIAALGCLLLAAGSALAPQHQDRAAAAAQRPGLGLRPGEVAVPVPVDTSGGAGLARAGDRVGVVAAPVEGSAGSAVLVADRLRVLRVDAGDSGLETDAPAVVVLATDRQVAVDLARYAGRPVRLIIDRVS